MDVWTKRGADIVAPTDAAGNPRKIINGEMQTWMTEVERLFDMGAFNSVDAKVSDIAGRAAYDDEPTDFMVLVLDTGDGRAAVYAKLSSLSADWSDPAYVTGPEGPPGVQVDDALTVNRGKPFPNRIMTRNGYTSEGSAFLNSGILAVRVVGAEYGKYYSIHYQKNGAVIPGSSYDYAWVIRRYDIAGFETSSANDRVVTFTDPAPDIDLAGGIQTVRVVSPRVDGLEFFITVDPAHLPAFGTVALNGLIDDRPGASWIIDPSNYFYSNQASVADGTGALSYSISAGGMVSAYWRSGDYLYRIRFGPNGFNDLPNIIGVDRASYSTEPVWTEINTGSTDWLTPMTVEAVNNGNPSLPMAYSGGNHGSNGGGGGSQTARNTFYRLLIDGQPQPFSAVVGSCSKITLIIINELMAYNTFDTERYVLSQTFSLDIFPGGIELHSDVKAYEDIRLKRENGPQMVTTGFQGTQLIYGGQEDARVAFDATADSGPKSANPDAWALVLQSANGQQVSWMDRAYEAGDGRYVGAAEAFIRGGGASNTKWYHAVVSGMGAGVEFLAGEGYKWRGGYAWQAPDQQPTGYDSMVVLRKGGRDMVALAKSASEVSLF
ncbi:hypothetical protein [Nitratireductor sp. GZWM139]|uniref:hypothetical protein n=1 Tax=Nitratireductor sp. GZWM139 TaxID=2950541 RepID=UPI0024BEF690|nr:hypothetical protein [Nitratireductor sp. GZWM139]MDJ1465649.1 hypothetical protein [Nitratireductor sp. GZWM139]